MKACLLKAVSDVSEVNMPLNLEDFPVPVLNEIQVLFQVSRSAVCYIELMKLKGATPPSDFPFILGDS